MKKLQTNNNCLLLALTIFLWTEQDREIEDIYKHIYNYAGKDSISDIEATNYMFFEHNYLITPIPNFYYLLDNINDKPKIVHNTMFEKYFNLIDSGIVTVQRNDKRHATYLSKKVAFDLNGIYSFYNIESVAEVWIIKNYND